LFCIFADKRVYKHALIFLKGAHHEKATRETTEGEHGGGLLFPVRHANPSINISKAWKSHLEFFIPP